MGNNDTRQEALPPNEQRQSHSLCVWREAPKQTELYTARNVSNNNKKLKTIVKLQCICLISL